MCLASALGSDRISENQLITSRSGKIRFAKKSFIKKGQIFALGEARSIAGLKTPVRMLFFKVWEIIEGRHHSKE